MVNLDSVQYDLVSQRSRMKRVLALVVIVGLAASLLSGCITLTEGTETADRSVTVPVGGTSSVRIVAGAGSLSVRGKSGLTEITAQGTAYALKESHLDQVEFVTRTSGGEIIVEARTEPSGSRFDITVEVPESFMVEIDDGSGHISVRDVAGVTVTDGTGDIDVDGVSGDAVIKDDGSGDVIIENVTGSVRIGSDGTGNIAVEGVGADVEITDDGSGGITASDVDGSFRIGADGSGNIVARDIRGDFEVDRDGSGGIEYSGIGGSVRIPAD
jgi:DUF4097 and DUF4098 domain-containing protein YvlB